MEDRESAVEGMVTQAMQSFWRGKRVFLTGHTGFKGSWLAFWLHQWGAEVTGYALRPPTEPNLFQLAGIEARLHSVIDDICDFSALQRAFDAAQPEIVFHLAAQPLVIESYRDPVGTYAANVMGTVYLLECVRQSDTVRSVLNVTTDKVYKNNEWVWGYRENDPLDGYDPYANSKSCSELVTHSYRQSFFAEGAAISTARAGNVIGGGDFAADRILPDCVRAALEGRVIELRNPHSTRPYQHVLEPLGAYLMIAQAQHEQRELAGAYNVGPDDSDCVTTGMLADRFCHIWGHGITWQTKDVDAPHEARFLKLDCSKLKDTFHWRPRWHIDEAIRKTVEWTQVYMRKGDVAECMTRQINEFVGGETACE